jgi:hypothetical protein
MSMSNTKALCNNITKFFISITDETELTLKMMEPKERNWPQFTSMGICERVMYVLQGRLTILQGKLPQRKM